MIPVFHQPENKADVLKTRTHIQRMAKAFVLVEVLLSMTVLAIAGTSLLRSIQNSINASRKARDTAKLIFLAKSKLHEYEMRYSFKPLADLGAFNGRFDSAGLRDYAWTAHVDYNSKHDAYFITVWVNQDQSLQNNWYSRRNPEGIKLVSMVPTARFNEFITKGYQTTRRGGGRR